MKANGGQRPLDGARVQDLLDGAMAQHSVVGAQIGLLSGDERVVACAGALSLEASQPVVASSAFHAGSLAKSLAAAVVLAAARRGDLELDERCDLQSPDLWDDTPRALMAQTSGRANLLPDVDEGIEDFVARAGALPRIHEQGRFSYCNAGWSALDLLLRRRTGATFEELAADQLRPGATFGIPPGAAEGHEVATDGRPRPVPPVFAEAASAAGSRWWATADQLLDYAEDNLGLTAHGPHPLDRSQMQSAHTHVPGATVADSWGLGWAIWERSEHRSFGWAGYTGGHRAYLRCFPEHRAALVVLTSTAGPLLGPPGGNALFDALLPGLLVELGIPPLQPLALPAVRSASELAGRYGPFLVEPDGDGLTLHAQPVGEPLPVPLVRVFADTFQRRGRSPGGMLVGFDADLLYIGPFAIPRG